eukprot:TRINITY_DN2263_c0_g1_i1.p1 TRINITY_DN2263_c0_g1~~TRINITY_DN2263_c0_g1_i1.p1  ORF type:complete len:178 (+),score=29.15 TRINITY_DN2263_c0_g1_i1:43-534(+)
MDANEQIRLRLLLARWLQESGEISNDNIEKELKCICKVSRGQGEAQLQEEPYFQYASFLDQRCVATAKTISETIDIQGKETIRFEGYRIPKKKYAENIAKNLQMAINCYAYAITKGNHHVFQSLPRMLKLQFEYGEDKPRKRKSSSRSSSGRSQSDKAKLVQP